MSTALVLQIFMVCDPVVVGAALRRHLSFAEACFALLRPSGFARSAGLKPGIFFTLWVPAGLRVALGFSPASFLLATGTQECPSLPPPPLRRGTKALCNCFVIWEKK